MGNQTQEYNFFSIRVYMVDSLKKEDKKNPKPTLNKMEFPNLESKYKILDISGNGTYGNKKQYGVPNHMQAITVAPNYIGENNAKK